MGGGWWWYCLPWGEVQVQLPSGVLLVMRHPAWVLSWWCLVHRAPRFVGFVSPPSFQGWA